MLSWRDPLGSLNPIPGPAQGNPRFKCLIHVQSVLDGGWKPLIKTLPLLKFHLLLEVSRNWSCHSSSYKWPSLPRTETSSLLHCSADEASLLKTQPPSQLVQLCPFIVDLPSQQKSSLPQIQADLIECIQHYLGTPWNSYGTCCWKNYDFSST